MDCWGLAGHVWRGQLTRGLSVHDIIEGVVNSELKVLFVALKIYVHDQMPISETANKITHQVEVRRVGN